MSSDQEYAQCPCCHYPTLLERAAFEICYLCHWEDDGQDDRDADSVYGGPNGSYSLAEARENFVQYVTMYHPNDREAFARTTVKTELKRTLMAVYTEIVHTSEPSQREALRQRAQELEQQLY